MARKATPGIASKKKASGVNRNQRSVGKPDVELGKRIRLRRAEQNIFQTELADNIGVSFQQVQKYEKGVNRIGAARLQRIATALDVPITFFYDGDGKSREVESLLFIDSSFFAAITSRIFEDKRSRCEASVCLADRQHRS